MSEFRPVAQNLRTHEPREGARQVITVHGDGSPEGSQILFEGSEAPGVVIALVIDFDGRRNELARGVLEFISGDEPAEGEEFATDTMDVWVRFGANPQALFEARSQVIAAVRRIQELTGAEADEVQEPLALGCGGCPGK